MRKKLDLFIHVSTWAFSGQLLAVRMMIMKIKKLMTVCQLTDNNVHSVR